MNMNFYKMVKGINKITILLNFKTNYYARN